MKKLIPVLLLLGVLALVFQLFVQFFIRHHEIDYSIITKDNSYLINEKLKIDGKKNNYIFKVVDSNKDTYLFSFEYDYNRQDRIIRDIKFFDNGDLKCIFPIYKKDKTSDVYCTYNSKQVSYTYLKQIDNYSIKQVISKLKKDKYSAISWAKDTVPKKEANYMMYVGNIPKDVVFTVWNYRGFYILSDGKFVRKEFLNNDKYENDLSLLTGNYYVSINTDMNSGNMYGAFYLYDVVNGGKGRIDLDEQISFNMYINGQYNGKFYYTDLNSKKEFVVDPDKETVKEVGNVKDGFKTLRNRTLTTVSAKEYLMGEDIWNNDVVNNRLKEMYKAEAVKKDNDMYYFLTEDGDFYKTSKFDLENAVKLFHFDSVSEWKVKDYNVMVISKDTMYYYNDVYGLLPIVSSNEFIYNYKNICDFVEK